MYYDCISQRKERFSKQNYCCRKGSYVWRFHFNSSQVLGGGSLFFWAFTNRVI